MDDRALLLGIGAIVAGILLMLVLIGAIFSWLAAAIILGIIAAIALVVSGFLAIIFAIN